MDPEQGNITPFVLLTHIYREIGQSFEDYVGMSMARIELLHELWHSGEVNQTALQRTLAIEGSLVTRYLKQMEASRLVQRRVDPRDNRFTLVKNTPEGEAVVQKMQDAGDVFEEVLLEGLNEDDRATFSRILTHIQGNLPRLAEFKKLEESGAAEA